MRIARLAAPMSLCLAAALVVPVTASASPTAASPEATQRVLLALTPQDRGALRAIAHAPDLDRGERAIALARALPGAARQAAVAETARSLGLSVERVGTTSVAVSGPASLVTSLFGSARSVTPASRTQHPLPRIPAVFGEAVTVAFGGDDTRPAFQHAALDFDATADGGDFRTAYGNTQTNPKKRLADLPSDVASATRAQTIATVQLSGWRTSNLSAYRTFLNNHDGTGWPVPSWSVVKDPFLPPTGYDLEVDLDQEAIYAVAPFTHQRAYLSANDLAGMYDSLIAIGDDASNPVTDHHVVAASISWGTCESEWTGDPNAPAFFAAMEDALSYDLATGVTVFAASGDRGGTCQGSTKGVFYPASSPQVVGVGGTMQPDTGGAPYCTWSSSDGGSPTFSAASEVGEQLGWVDPTVPDTEQLVGSGGGYSRLFPRPDFQDGVNTTNHKRAVPDIAALAGCPYFDVVTTVGGDLGYLSVGGTSLSAPVATATYAGELAQHGYSWGIGNILPGLYAQQTYASAPGAGFTDVDDGCTEILDSDCPGWNGVDVAHAGYDLVTGLGTPLWNGLLDAELGGDPHLSVVTAYSRTLTVPVKVRTPDWLTFDHYRIDVDGGRLCTTNGPAPAEKPTSVRIEDNGDAGSADGVHQLILVAWNEPETIDEDVVCHFAEAFVLIDTRRPLPTAKLAVGDGTKDVVASWRSYDGINGSGVNRYKVVLRTQSGVVASRTTSRPGTIRVAGKPGKVYTLQVTATDRAGNSRTVTARLLDDRQFGKSGSWSRVKAAGAFDRTLSSTGRAGASASARVPGFSYSIVVTTCPTCGKLAVFVGGSKTKTVNTYSVRTHHRVTFTVFTGRSDATRKVVVKALGTKSSSSGGTRILLDAVTSKG
jgi:hypothetical protein